MVPSSDVLCYYFLMSRPPLVISACLAGHMCRYNGCSVAFAEYPQLEAHYTLIPVCPEQLGGLPTPRPPSEIRDNKVYDVLGNDVTHAFVHGSRRALTIAQESGCTIALLMERSPSCGYQHIYDGTFTKTLVPGDGIFASLLKKQGFTIYTPKTIRLLLSDIL